MDKIWRLLELPLSDYRQVIDLQERILAETFAGPQQDTLILVEHQPVFTLGNRINPENIKVNKRFLKARQIELVQTRRGGDITYHGPGQIVAYPIISLKEHRLSLPSYINHLEDVMLQTATKFGVKAHRSIINRGVWCEEKKLGSVGISIKKGISYHGLALNTNMDLTPFSWINPCGLEKTAITSLAQESDQHIAITKVRSTICEAFSNTFQITLKPMQAKDIGLHEDIESTDHPKTCLA